MARWLASVTLAAGSVLLVLVAAELVARWTWEPDLPPPRPPLPDAWRDLPDLRSIRALDRPNLRGLNAGALFETNSTGFRGPERTPEKPPGTFRIEVLGDSFTMGWGVSQEDTYAARLERILGERRPERIEVLNLGLAGQDTVAAVDRLERLGLDFDPDLIVYGFTLNDLENELYRRSSVPLEAAVRAIHRSPIHLWRVLAPRIGPLVEVLFAPQGTYLHELDDNYFEHPEAFHRAQAALDRLHAIAEERGICAVVLLHTRLHFLNVLHPYHRHYEVVAEAARTRGFFVVPTVQAFLGRKDRDLWVAPNDPHPGPEAHAILAETLAAGLEALPPRCWRSD